MDHQPLSFGIEFELALFFLSSPTPDPHPTDGRVVRGLDTTDYVPNPPNPDIHPNYFENVEGYVGDDVRVRTNIANTLQTAGLRARVELWGISDEADEDMRTIPYDTTQAETKWSVSTDPTILAELEPYDRAQIEITSPALMFSPAALNDVQLVCETITSKYRTIINKSCGLHVIPIPNSHNNKNNKNNNNNNSPFSRHLLIVHRSTSAAATPDSTSQPANSSSPSSISSTQYYRNSTPIPASANPLTQTQLTGVVHYVQTAD